VRAALSVGRIHTGLGDRHPDWLGEIDLGGTLQIVAVNKQKQA
jgi:hypothetical protein